MIKQEYIENDILVRQVINVSKIVVKAKTLLQECKQTPCSLLVAITEAMLTLEILSRMFEY